MVLVVGATGWLGSEICRRLRKKGETVLGLVRSGSPRLRELEAMGVKLVPADIKDRASMVAALKGVDTVVDTATAIMSKRPGDSLKAVDHDGQLALVAEAKKAGVKRFVFVSVSPNLPDRGPLVVYKRVVEKALRDSGMNWTILQPGNFMEIWLSAALAWDIKAGEARVFGTGDAPLTYVSLLDVAEAAIAVLGGKAENEALPLAGEALSQNEAVKVFEEVSGKRFRVKKIPEPLIKLTIPIVGLVSPVGASLMALGLAVAQGDAVDAAPAKKLGLKFTTVREFAQCEWQRGNHSPPARV